MGSLRVGEHGVDEVELLEQRLDIVTTYATSRELAFTLLLPTLRRRVTWRQSVSERYFGPGDAELRSKVTVWRSEDSHREAAILMGLKVPTALEQKTPAGERLPVDLQPGTGALSPLLGAFYFTRSDIWSGSTSAFVYVPVPVKEDAHSATAWRANATLQCQPSRSFASRLGVVARIDGSSETDGSTDENSGGFVGYVSTEIVVSPVTDLLITAGAYHPALQVLRGRHVEGTVALLGLTLDL